MNTEININQFNSLEDVSNALNTKYSKIEDFKTYVDSNKIKGGFYKMSYICPVTRQNVSYYFHETFMYLTEEVDTFEKLYEYGNNVIQKQLKSQKDFDELYAKDNNKPVVYQFDYSLIEKPVKVVIRHNTKGYYQHPDRWITREENSKWATRYTIEEAREVAKTLKDSNGFVLKNLQIISFYRKDPEFGFQSYVIHAYITNEPAS